LLYITFLANLEHSSLFLGSILKWITWPWKWKMLVKICKRTLFLITPPRGKGCCWILAIFLQEYRHKFGENIHFMLPSSGPLLVHLKVIKSATYSRVFF
jgi:hypothetical protein